MNFLEHFYLKTLKYDLSNRFLYKNTKELPKLKKIILNFGCKTSDLKQLSASLLALELITNQKVN
jgi:ribosomal protein L5